MSRGWSSRCAFSCARRPVRIDAKTRATNACSPVGKSAKTYPSPSNLTSLCTDRPGPHAPATDASHHCRERGNNAIPSSGTTAAVDDWLFRDGYEMNVHACPLRPDGPSGADNDRTLGYFQAHQHIFKLVFIVASDRLLRPVAVDVRAHAAQTSC